MRTLALRSAALNSRIVIVTSCWVPFHCMSRSPWSIGFPVTKRLVNFRQTWVCVLVLIVSALVDLPTCQLVLSPILLWLNPNKHLSTLSVIKKTRILLSTCFNYSPCGQSTFKNCQLSPVCCGRHNWSYLVNFRRVVPRSGQLCRFVCKPPSGLSPFCSTARIALRPSLQMFQLISSAYEFGACCVGIL